MNGALKGKVNTEAWIQELKSNHKTQAALGAFALVMVYMLWPKAPIKKKTTAPTISAEARTAADDHQLESIRQLRDLTQLDLAGELPNEGRMYRDLFLFDMPPGPPPPPRKPEPPPPEPPPPTAEELAAMELARARQEATNSRPQSLRYLGYMGRPSTGRIGSFLKGEEVLSIRLGDLASPNWKLVTLRDTFAEFEHLKFPDIRYKAEAMDRQGTSSPNPVNEF